VYLLVICTSSFEKSLFSSFALYWLKYLLFWCLIFWIHYVFWILISNCINVGKDFLPSVVGLLFLLLCWNFLIWYNPICQFLLFPELSEYYSEGLCLFVYLEVFPLFSSSSLNFKSYIFLGGKYLFLFYHFYIYSHVYTLFGRPPFPPASGQNMFYPLILRFCWRENIRDNKKDTASLLVWDKDSYTERFLALLLCTCVLQLTLVHLYQTSSQWNFIQPQRRMKFCHSQVNGWKWRTSS
jgi:hypothetical protein